MRINVHRIISYCFAPLFPAHERGAQERFSIKHNMPFTMDLNQLAKLTAHECKSLETARGRLFKHLQGLGHSNLRKRTATESAQHYPLLIINHIHGSNRCG
jgi:hypothetical protein